MADSQDHEDWRREHSLLALGEAMRGDRAERPAPPLHSVSGRADASWAQDAAARHSRARSLREPSQGDPAAAEPTEPLGDETEADAGPAADGASSGLAGLLPRWFRSRRPVPAAADAPDTPDAAPLRERPVEARGDALRGDPRAPSGMERHSAFVGAGDQQWKPLIDPMKVIGGITGSKLLILAMTVAGALAGVAIAMSTPKKYEAITEVIVNPSDLKLTDRDLTQSIYASDATLAIVENRMRVLTSGTVLGKVVDKLNLANDPEFNGESGGGIDVMSMVRSILSRDDGPAAADDGRRRALAIANLAESLSVERGGKTFVITVGATTENGEKSALIANTMTDVFMQTSGQMQSETAGRATNELTARLGELRRGVDEAEHKVEAFRAEHDLVDAQGHLISDDELLKLNEQLSVTRARTLELNARAASARSLDVASVLGGTLPEEITSTTMSDLRSQYAALKQQDDSAAIRLGPRHPERLALDAQLAGARERIAAELKRIAASLQVDLKRSVELEQQLSSRLAQLKVRSGGVNNDLITLRELEREATAKRSVYEAYLLRAKETGEQKDINTANISVLSKAYAPLQPTGPSRALIAMAGLLLGFASGVGLGAMRGAYESLRDSANSRAGAERRREAARDDAYGAPRRDVPAPPLLPDDPAAFLPPGATSGAPDEPPASIEEIRSSLREFREAVRELTESRARRRYF